ncbi:hypothetical protein BD410DRAFT_894310 [Rickenella mellea]|uniref:C3H1-type domain-containing protein n=1 Tax=Rickenella mellea TaxID=50990 RepID=A0A4Y7QKP7_9AGAM|nr:hypothetical protein BD410DRAFT_894310 [Rickenella mellea]
MVSPLWKASAEGNVLKVHELLQDASPVDIEIKDHTGVTPLIQAVRNGHREVVRILLERGADPSNASSHGTPDQYTSDPTILEVLKSAREKNPPHDATSPTYPQHDVYSQEQNGDPSKGYYAPPPGAYVYYPSIHPNAPMMPDGTVPYYAAPPPPPSASQPSQSPAEAGGPGNLPPPEIARLIPCRYFPACRYGPSCMFAHPQAPYYQGPLPPPAQFPVSYDPVTQPTYGYYTIPPAPYAPNGISAHGTPMSPPPPGSHHPAPTPPITHGRSASELMSPAQVPFSPSGGPPPPLPYGITSPMSPSYAQPGQIPIPVGIAPLPPLHHQHGPQQPNQMVYSPSAVATHGPPSPVVQRRDSNAAYPQALQSPRRPADANMPQSPQSRPQAEGYLPLNPNGHRDAATNARRGTGRRYPVNYHRKPPCLFFPTGRCRNGDDCRFPHVMPDPSNPSTAPHYPSKSGARGRLQNPPHSAGTLEDKLSPLSIQENGRSTPSEGGGNPRAVNGYKQTNGIRNDKRYTPRQRIPNADDFPVLVGSTTPPSRSPGPNGRAGPTAAQVLQAPPPARRASRELISNGDSSDQEHAVKSTKEVTHAAEPNGVVMNGVNGLNGTHESSTVKPSPSFAAVTTAADTSNQVSVSA